MLLLQNFLLKERIHHLLVLKCVPRARTNIQTHLIVGFIHKLIVVLTVEYNYSSLIVKGIHLILAKIK